MINNIVLQRLKEREKELNTLYNLEELLSVDDLENDRLFRELITLMPHGWQYSTICEIKVTFEGKEWHSEDFRETDWIQKADIVVDNNVSGEITVTYLQLIREFNGSQFLPEEQKLLNTISDRVGNYLFQQRLRNSFKALGAGNGSANSNEEVLSQTDSDPLWKWRLKMAEHICRKMDMAKFGVKAIYLIGSTKNATAGPASDLDLMIHHQSGIHQLENLKSWIEGWSLCLAEENFQRTGYQSDGLIDLHLITDSDIEARTSFAVMIGSVTDGARLLR